ncbi:MAG: hypothetical protein ABI683_05620 [Ginsengibacter sp.]
MKKLLAFFLLVSHMNTSMFLPQVPETDLFDASGNQLDDINSVTEFIMIKLGIDHHVDDEDDDSGQVFHPIKTANFYFQVTCSEIKTRGIIADCSNTFSEFKVDKIPDLSTDVIIPPPKSAA